MSYAQLAPYYDAIFPCTAERKACYDHVLPEAGGRPVVDVGFGTGADLAYLVSRGAAIHGVEVTEEQVDFARRRFPRFAGSFVVGEMTSASRLFDAPAFDLTLLVGNTLPHAADRDEAARALREMARLTGDKGVFVLSTLNYDRILDGGIADFPAIRGETSDGKRFVFGRRYDLGAAPESVEFLTRLETPDETFEGRHALLPLRREELLDMTQAAFGRVDVFGGYGEETWTRDSAGTVVIASAPRRDEGTA